MRKNFESSLRHVLNHEGGYVDHPKDPGGATNRGITLKVFRAFYGQHLGKSDLRQITEREAGAIYKANYWDKCQCDKLPDGLDYAVFDQAVNSGPSRSIRWLQGSCGAQGDEIDGLLGPATFAKVKSMEPPAIIIKMCAVRLKFLKSLSHWKDFGRGWKKRVDGVEEIATVLAGGEKVAAPAAAVPAYEILKKGSAGPGVKKLQRALNQVLAGQWPAMKVDGDFGPGTRKALIEFQRDAGLDADGVAGHNTWQALGLVE
ncbi:glycosyl hydrolase 108 family protein [Candidatus Litorirhabdus singularis]|uniref:glycosyl hydrolase 108 family protein n=1 Tax=Candidatus Litorirhabdus singularis TaxID=2518993 RepID=UPI00242F9D8A|nr:glycosyl hydrolase 108 family protein [Candidatus Litorirhabdus singularis]